MHTYVKLYCVTISVITETGRKNIPLSTGDSFQGSNPQRWSAHPYVTDMKCPLDEEECKGDNTDRLIVDHCV